MALSYRGSETQAVRLGLRIEPQDQRDLEWLLEEALLPLHEWESSGRYARSHAAVRRIGQTMFSALTASDAMRRIADDALGDTPMLVIEADNDASLGLPWEYMWDHSQGWLSERLAGIWRRRMNLAPVSSAHTGNDARGALRVLLVISRPAAEEDVPYRIIAQPLLARLRSAGANAEVLRPGTFSAFVSRLYRSPGAIDLVHYDGHGTGGELAFEDGMVSAEKLASVLRAARVPLFVLNACRSGTVDVGRVPTISGALSLASVAHALLAAGGASVLAMGYSVRVVTARVFMDAFYQTLISGDSIAAAAQAGRRAITAAPASESVGPLDWGVPVVYQVEDRRIAGVTRSAPASAVEALQKATAVGAATIRQTSWDVFVGRDGYLYRLDRMLDYSPCVLVHGVAGIGKTTLIEHLLAWRRETLGAAEIVFFSFRGSAPLARLVAVLEEKLRPEVTDLSHAIWQSASPADRLRALGALLRDRPWMIVLDNFETLTGYPRPEHSRYSPEDIEAVVRFLDEAAGGAFRVLLTSRRDEHHDLGLRPARLHLGGLDQMATSEALIAYARRFGLESRFREALRDQEGQRAFDELIRVLQGHPLAIRVAVWGLREASLQDVTSSVKGRREVIRVPAEEEGARSASLEAVLAEILENVPAETRHGLALLGLFQGQFHEQHLLRLVGHSAFPEGILGDRSEGFLRDLLAVGEELGLAEREGGSGLWRVVPGSQAALRETLGRELDQTTLAALEMHACRYWAVVCGRYWRDEFEHGGGTAHAVAFVLAEEENLSQALDFASSHALWAEAGHILQSILDVWSMTGRWRDADFVRHSWLVRTSSDEGTPRSADDELVALWRFLKGREAGRLIDQGRLDEAEQAYRRIVDALEQALEPDKPNLAAGYHQLGIVEQERARLDAAEAWYRKSLAIEDELGNEGGIASSYHQLGIVEQRRGRLDAAEAWYRKSLAIKETLGDRTGMSSGYGQLGTIELQRGRLDAAERWYRQSLAISEELGDRPTMAITYHQLGSVNQQRGRLDAAEDLYRKSLVIREEVGDRSAMAGTYHQLGLVEQHRGRLDAAEAWYRKSLAIKEGFGDRLAMASSYHQLGILEQRRGRLDAAEAWYRKSLAIEEELGDRPGIATSYGQLGNLDQQRGRLDAAEDLYRRSLEIREELDDRLGMSSTYGQLGNLERVRGRPDAAEAWYRESLAISEELGDRPRMAMTYRHLGLLDLERGHLVESETLLQRSLAIDAELENKAGMLISCRELGRLQRNLGRLDLADEFDRKAQALEDELQRSRDGDMPR